MRPSWLKGEGRSPRSVTSGGRARLPPHATAAPPIPLATPRPITDTASDWQVATPRNIGSPRAQGTGALEIGNGMSLSKRVTQQPERLHGLPCSVGQLLNTLEGPELEALVTMLGDPDKRDGWSAGAIYDALTAEGYKVGYQTIGRHRGGKCRCDR